MHLPFMWKFRLLRALHAGGRLENRRFLDAMEKAEGSRAKYNPLDTTQPWPGATPYNTFGNDQHVWDYPNGAAGIAATAATFVNGNYPGLLAALRDRTSTKSAAQMVLDHRAEIAKWGTNPDAMLRILQGR